MVKKFKRIILRVLLALVILVALGYVAIVIYVSLHKKELIQDLTEQVSEKINGSVAISDMEISFFNSFPRVSILLKKVKITDSLFARHRQPFFTGAEVAVQLNAGKLLQNELQVNGIKIKDALIFLFTDSSGYSNEYLLKPQQKPSGNKQADRENKFHLVKLNNVAVHIYDALKNHDYNVLAKKLDVHFKNREKDILLEADADLQVHALAFNIIKGSFLKEASVNGKFDLTLTPQQLVADNIKLNIGGNPFAMSARFDLQGKQPQFDLKLDVQDIRYGSLKKLVTPKIAKALSKVGTDHKLDVTALVTGPLRGGEPLIKANWTIKGAKLSTPFFDFKNASFSGSYTNEVDSTKPRKDSNSKIEIRNFKGDWQGLPVTSQRIDINDLQSPTLNAQLQSQFSITDLNRILGSNVIQMQKGDGTANLSYVGPLERNRNANSFLNGVITIDNGLILYTPRNVELRKVKGKLVFKNSDVEVQDLQCTVLNNTVTMSGGARNLLTLINDEVNRPVIDWNIYSPALNLESFIFLLSPATQVQRARSASPLGSVSHTIDDLLANGRLHVTLQADKLKYKKLSADKFSANVMLLPESYEIRNVSMQHGGGEIQLKGTLLNRHNNYHQANFDADIRSIDVKKIFNAFNNFGQDAIEGKHLEGRLSAHATGTFGLNNEGNPYPGSVAGDISFSLKDGALNNFEPIKKIQEFIFKKRDFENIRFAELKDDIRIANEEIYINRMEIASSVMRIFVEGVYSMRGNTDLSIQIPLSNLKKRDEDEKPTNKGVDSKTGTSLYLRGRPGEDGNIKFKADLFNRFKKENNKSR